jgi:hypothetical protein
MLGLAFCAAALSGACGGDDPEVDRSSPPTDAGPDRVRAKPGLAPTPPRAPAPGPVADASCDYVIDAPTIVPSNHVAESEPVAYVSNPPSSGPHYPRWANFQEFAQPVGDGYLVHAMEHGAVLLLYKCDPASCPPIVEALRAVRDAIPTDPACDPAIRVRVILAPRPELDVPVAAAAWGFTYKAGCVDAPSLSQFVTDHYAKAPENFCVPGATTF